MKVKPKDIQVDLPSVFQFNSEDEIAALASNVNTIIHGKVKVKYELLGMLGGQYVGIFYLQRNDEFTELRDSFVAMIEDEEMADSFREEKGNRES